MRWAVSTGRLDSAIELGRAIDHAFPLERRFGAWGAELDLVHAAALAAGDHRSEAWALHQLGTRAICLGELALGVALLEQARELHGELGDAQGAACSAHNLRLATRPRWFWHWIAGHSLLMAVVASLVVAGVVAAAVLPGGKAPPAQSSAASPATSTPAEVATSSTISAPSSTSTSTSQPSPTPASGNNPNPGGAPPTTTTTNPPVTLTIEVPNGGTVRSKPGLIDCPDTCSEGFPVGTPLTLVASGPAFWSGAPGCPPPPPTSVIARIQGSSSPQTSASSAGAPTDSTTSAATSNTAPSSTCPITLERSTTVSVLVLPG
jgi:hypothetical protein